MTDPDTALTAMLADGLVEANAALIAERANMQQTHRESLERLAALIARQQAHITRLEAEVDWMVTSRLRMKDRYRNSAIAANTRAETAEAQNKAMSEALERQRANIEHWISTGKAASPEESKSIYDQICAALEEGGGKPS